MLGILALHPPQFVKRNMRCYKSLIAAPPECPLSVGDAFTRLISIMDLGLQTSPRGESSLEFGTGHDWCGFIELRPSHHLKGMPEFTFSWVINIILRVGDGATISFYQNHLPDMLIIILSNRTIYVAKPKL